MTAAHDHYQELLTRARGHGIALQEIELEGFGTVAMSYRRTFRWRWIATTLHVFTFLAARPTATAAEIKAFARACGHYAATHKPGLMRGLQTGSAALPIVVMDGVSAEVRDAVAAKPEKRFAIISLPAVVDASTEQTYTVRDQLVWGALYDGYLRAVIRDHVGSSADIDPEPGSVRRMKLIYGVAMVLGGLGFILVVFSLALRLTT